jgi:hypothetical protein
MRVPFDNEGMSFVNRVWNVLLGKTGYKGSYVGQDQRMVASLWYEAERLCDFGGETDAVMDTYPQLNEAFQRMMSSNESDDNVGDAENIALGFENKLYLAMVVANAIRALEGASFSVYPNNDVWASDNLEAIYNEFKKERELISKRIDNILALSSHLSG